MDASKQATGKADDKQHGKDDVRAGKAEGRYEGGRDADQNRQAKEGFGGEPPATPEPAAQGKGRHGEEEEE